jgi:benzil reductase ((S)-benzoin forming)
MRDEYIIITGSTGGIGNQLARICLDLVTDMRGCFLYRDQDKFNRIFSGVNIDHIDTCIHSMEEVRRLNLEDIIRKQSKIDKIILVLTAFTIEPIKRIEEQDIEEVTRNLNINIVSQLNIILEVLKYTKEKHLGLRIINIDSGAAYRAIEGWSLYSCAKSYMNMYLKSLKLEENIDIVTYDPGVVDTNMQAVIRNQKEEYTFVEQFRGCYTNGKLKDPNSVAMDIFERYIVDWKTKNFEERYL